MKKLKLFLLILPIFVFVFLFKTAVTASAACDGSLSYPGGSTCTTRYPNHSLNATWNVTPQAGQNNSSCNIYIRGNNVDTQISTSCSNGSATITSFNGAPLTNDGHYKLFVSNGGAECLNQQKDDVTIPCAVGNCSATIEEARRQLIAAGGNYQNATCDEVKNKVCTDCTIFVPPNPIRTALCPGTCGGGGSPSPSGGGGSCPPDSKLTVTPQTANIGATMTFQYRAGEDVYIGGDTWNPSSSVSACKEPGSPGNPLEDRRYICTAASATNNGVWNHYWGSPKTCGSATYTITSPSAATVSYRIAENPTDLAAAQWQDYTAAGMNVPFEFTDKAPGVKTVFVQFKDSSNPPKTGGCGVDQSQSCQKQIKLLGSDPVMTNCFLSFEESSAVLNLTGQNFGSTKGTVKSGDTDLQVRSWKNDRIQAVLQNAPIGQVLPVTFTNTDGQTGTDQCSSISQLSLGAKTFCRAPASHDTDNVDMALVDETGKKMRQTVRIDKNGIVQGLTQRLEDGRRYTLSLKAPKSLKRNVPFTAGGGTVSLPNFVLPVGDIFPLDGGDGIINSLDKSELNREWNISGNATGRPGDFNQDGRVNSIDWACMRYDYGQFDDPEPVIPPPAPSPNPSVSPSASPSPSPFSGTWQPFADANTFRNFIFQSFGFTDVAKTLIKNNSTIEVKDLKNACGGGGWQPGNKKVLLNCAQYEAALHELSHVWWHTYRLQNPDMVKGLAKDVVRLSNGDGSTTAINFAKGYVNGIGSWKGMYCTDNGCADPQNIKDSDFDLTEAATNAKIIDWEIYAGFSSWTMGKYKDGTHALPNYMWKYFEPEFTSVISETPYYDGGHP